MPTIPKIIAKTDKNGATLYTNPPVNMLPNIRAAPQLEATPWQKVGSINDNNINKSPVIKILPAVIDKTEKTFLLAFCFSIFIFSLYHNHFYPAKLRNAHYNSVFISAIITSRARLPDSLYVTIPSPFKSFCL